MRAQRDGRCMRWRVHERLGGCTRGMAGTQEGRRVHEMN
jgi:hypothetical protein